ncbi:MAG: polyprenyl synthetase family protein [Cellulomonas sp.]
MRENRGILGARTRPGSDTAPRPREPVGLYRDVEAAMVETSRTLRRFLSERRAQALAVAPAYADLWEAVSGQVGGKLVRPRLTVASYLGFGGIDVNAIASVAAAQELLHTAMLVHDDVLDADEVRRGAPNITGTYRARLAGQGVFGAAAEHQLLGAGLLGGDLALSAAFELLASSSANPAVVVEAVRALARTVATTVAGELLDVGGELLSPFEVDPLLVAELKTAMYSFCGPLQVGALLAHAPASASAHLDRFGSSIGVAFQLVDDELGVFGSPAATGKSVLSDLRAGKRTELLRLTYLLTDDDGRAVLARHVGDPDLDDDGADEVRRVMLRSGARDRVRALAAGAARSARQTATQHLPAALADYLSAFVDELGERNH